MDPESAVRFVWLAWVISWFAASAWSDRAVTRPPAVSEIVYRLLSAGGAVLLFGAYSRRYLADPIAWHVGASIGWAMVVLAALGLLFTWWARIYLGRLWSSGVARKAAHHIVDTGPYTLVRHPIYTGIILSTVATAIIRGRWFAFLGMMLIMLSLWVKARLEEHFLREQLGAAQYDAYAQRVPRLLPLLRIR